MADLKKTFGQRLKAARKAKGMTQEELGRAINIDYKHLSAIERGAKAPSFDVVERAAKVLKVNHYELFLPGDVDQIDTEAMMKAVLVEMDRSQRNAIRHFFNEVLRLVKKIDGI